MPPALPAQPQPPRDQPPDWRPGDDLCPPVHWRDWHIARIVGAGIMSWLILGALGFAVFWVLS